MKTPFSTKFLQFILLPLFVFVLNVGWGQVYYDMSAGNYSQNFADMANWTNNYAAGTGASNYKVAATATGSTVNAGTVFAASTTAGVQKGTQSLIILATGNNSSATDLLLNLSGRTAGTLSLDWVKVVNTANASPRSSDLKIQYSTDGGSNFTDITGYTIPRILNNSTAESGSLSSITLPAALNNQSTVVLRFYVWNNSQTGGSGNRPKWQLDNISVTSTVAATSPAAPTITGITAGNQQLSVAFTAGSDGGSAITNYKYSTDGGLTFTACSPAQTSSPITITGLTNGTSYNVQIKAVNAIGDGTATAGASATPRTTPSAPTITGITAGNQQLSVAFMAGSDGGSAITTYKYSTNGGANWQTRSAGTTASPLVISTLSSDGTTALTNGVSFDIQIRAVNAAGDGTASSTTAATPVAPVSPTLNAVTLSSSLTSTYGTASTGVSFAANGSNLTAENITATAELGYQVSTDNSSFGSSASVASGTTVYVRLASTLSAGNYDNQVAVVLSGGGASSNVNVTTSSSGNTVSKATPTINSSPTATAITYGQTLASSTLSEGSASVAGSFAFTSPSTAPNAGTANQSITFSPTDNVNYNTTTDDVSVTVNKANQTITFTALANKTTADGPFALTATASSGLTVSYTSSNTAVATVSGSTVTIVGAGTTIITASQSGNENYSAAVSASQNLVVTLAPVTLANWNFGTTSPGSAVAAGVASNLAVSTLVSGNSFGNTTLLGTTSASNNSGASGSYNAGVAANVGALNVGSTTNAYFEFTITPNTGYYFSLTNISFGSRSTGTGPIAYSIRSSANGYASDLALGSLSNASTWAAYSTTGLNLTSAVQTAVTFRIYGYNGTGSPGSGSINWRIDDLKLTGNVIIAATPPTLTADATANTVDNNIDITFTEDATWRNAITAVKIGATTLTPITDYAISAGNIQLLPSGGNALLTTAGTKAITVVASGYTNATVSQVINAGIPTSNSTATINAILASGATRTITCTAKDQYNNLVSGYTFSYDATVVANNATISETYVIDGTTTSSTLNDIGLASTTNPSGVATFTVIMPSALDEADGLSIQVQLANGSTNVGTPFAYHELPSQTITFNALDAKIYGDASFNLSATGGASGNAVVFTSSNTSVATCTGTNGSTVTIVGAGTATIYANQAASSSYNAAAQVSQVLVVNQKGLTISGIGAADKVYNGSSAAAITGTPVYVGLVNGETFTVTGIGVATFSDAEVGVAKTVTFTGYIVPSANYSLTQPTTTATISQATQTISFGPLPNRFVGGPAFALTQNATSGLAITYTSSNTSVATIVGNTVTPVGAGTTTITASQIGNNNYTAAVSLTQDLTVIATPIAGWDFFGQSSPATYPATTYDTNLDSNTGLSEITRGPGANSNGAGNSFSTTGFQNNGVSTANTDYFQVTLKAKSGYSLSLNEINANFDGTSSYYATPGVTSQYAYSLDGANFTLIGSPITSTSLKPESVSLSGISDLQSVTSSTTVTIRYYASGQTNSGGWRFSSPSAGVLGLAIGGSLCQLPAQLSLSSTSFCNNGETATINSTTSELGVTYDLFDSNGIISNTSKPGTGSPLSWTGLTAGNYYAVGTNDAGGCASVSSSITLTATAPSYSYYTDTDADGFGSGAVLLSCSATTPSGYSTLNTDCNNNNAAIRPNATEVCGDGIDNNCDNNETYPNQYRSAVESGDWSVASTWEKSCSEGIWEAAFISPSNQYFNASTPFVVTIQSGHTVTVSTTSTSNFAKVGSLSVTGNLIVNGNLTVTSSVINSGNVTINHGASFVQTNQVVGNNNTGNGNFIVNMNLTGTSNAGGAPNGRYWYIGSPMNNTPASLFYDVPNKVRLWIYQPTNNSWVTLINSSTTASGENNSTLLIPGMGYLYRSGSPETVTFSGNASQFNNNMTTPLALTGAGYKYVANPYSSHIDWRQVTRTGLNVSYWIRNTTNTAYEAYNATSGVSTPSGTQTTQFIPPMQGFWVYAFTTSSSLRMDNGDRTHSTNGLHAPLHNQIVRLNLNDGKTDDQAVVYENENASNGIEEYDTDKFMDENHHQVYFLEGNKQLTLDGLKDATAKQKVDMGIQITSSGTYTINAVELGVEEDVVLEDKFTHTFQDLKRNSTYSFTSNAGTYNNRFVLHFTLNPQTETELETETVTVGETVGETEGVNIYTTTGQQVKVWVTNTTDFQNATVKVYDAIGNMIERKNMTSSELLLDLNTATGVYLVEVTGANKTFTKKVFIGK